MSTKRTRLVAPESEYAAFSQLDGRHPWSDALPEGALLYSVRKLSGGKVSYFNYNLAKEMGLIGPDHPHEMTPELKQHVLDTFCLRIINEYDQEHKLRVPRDKIKPHKYMATRYLQMQHIDKTGRTSGDGRCIWNGTVFANGRIWDVSSRGTGVTALAPGVVRAGRPLQTGNTDQGYGCGMAEIDELFGASILAEIFHRNGIPTERVLAIVDLGKGIGIGVRAAPNLLRPAHMFSFLKQGRLDPLKRSVDYFIDRQQTNKAWPTRSDEKDRYSKFLGQMVQSFARFAALLERDYIFAWLEWDGDNVLADAGIIDYGSVRQFGLRHDQYRYDDIERYSTNLNEQRQKTREIVQTFVQLVDFLHTGVKKPWGQFASHPRLQDFDRQFHQACLDRFLYQMGFVEPIRRVLLNRHRREVERFFAVHCEFEKVKTHKKLAKVADGIHRPAIYNMRVGLAKMADYVDGLPMLMTPLAPSEEVFGWILAEHSKRSDRKLTRWRRQKLARWQELYLKVLRCASTAETWDKTTAILRDRSSRINHSGRVTGNALIHIVDQILRFRRRGLSDAEIQSAIEDLISEQTMNPDIDFAQGEAANLSQPVLRTFLSVVQGFKEDI
jgi:uncharacterized protein YdiU (UPF0061 family)